MRQLNLNLQQIAGKVTFARLSVLVAVLTVIVPAILVACFAAGLSFVLGVLVAAVVGVVVLFAVTRTCPARVGTDTRGHRILFALWMALSLYAGYRIAGMSMYMLNVENVAYAVNPKVRSTVDPDLQKPFYVKHNCFTCYVIGAHLADQRVDNIYDRSQYRDPEHETAIHRRIGDALTIDTYQYPPPFLILPRLMMVFTNDFFQLRSCWFAFSVLLICFTLSALARWIGGAGIHAYWFAWPLLLAAPVMHSTLQLGNVHFIIICIVILAMLAFEQRMGWLGGILLGFAIVAKLFPGVLLAYLVIRRQWRAVSWTLAAMVAYVLVTLALFGFRPFQAFMEYHLPRLASGEAFSFMTAHIRALTLNLSAMGIAYKLDKLELLQGLDAARVASVITWIHSAAILAAVIAVGVRHGRRRTADFIAHQGERRVELAQGWLALLVLGQLRAPFLPWTYGGLAILWLLTLMVPWQRRSVVRMGLWAVGFLVYAVPAPLRFGPPTGSFDIMHTLGATLLAITMCGVVVFRRSRLNLAEGDTAHSSS